MFHTLNGYSGRKKNICLKDSDEKVGIHVVRVKYRRRPKAALKRVVPRIF